jgi:methylisocitrate lyase
MTVQDDRVEAFRQLHAAGCFVMPNPWDVGSARALEGLGFPALATTSAGFAWTTGRPDYAVEPEQVAEHVRRAAATGIAGLSIEDSTGDAGDPLHDVELAVERIRAARQAIDASGTGVLLTARSEGFVVGRPDLDETVRRLRAYSEAGADCLYAPRISTADQVAAVVSAVAPRPVNLLVNTPFVTVAEAAALGVRRISVGGTLARTAWGAFLVAAGEIAEHGTFTRFEALPDVDSLLRRH